MPSTTAPPVGRYQKFCDARAAYLKTRTAENAKAYVTAMRLADTSGFLTFDDIRLGLVEMEAWFEEEAAKRNVNRKLPQ